MLTDDRRLPIEDLLTQETIWRKFLDQLPPTDQLVAIMKAFTVTEGGTILVGTGGEHKLTGVTAGPVLGEIDLAVGKALGPQVRAVSRQSSPPEVVRNAVRVDDKWVVRAEVPPLFQRKLFLQLTPTQARLLTVMTEEGRDTYWAMWTHNSLWTLRFFPSHPFGKMISGFEETDLRAIWEEKYITLDKQSETTYQIGLKQRALAEYADWLSPALPDPKRRAPGF